MRILMASLVVVLGLAGMAPAGATSPAAPPAGAPTAAAAAVAAEPPIAQFPDVFTERSLGKPDAPVTLIEYSALTCSHCAHFHKEVLPRLKADYIDTGKVRLVFREFPFSQVGIRAAMAARCLPPEKYYDFVQALFDTQKTWADAPNGDQMVQQMAGFAGLSFDQYTACVGNERILNHVLQMRVDATNNFEINSTPTILIHGVLERIVGAQPYATFAGMIDRQLTRLGVAVPVHTPPAAPAP